jgi:hypothetical protein
MSREESHLIGRRAALSVLGAGALAVRQAAAAEQGLHSNGIDHVEFPASNVEKSVAF